MDDLNVLVRDEYLAVLERIVGLAADPALVTAFLFGSVAAFTRARLALVAAALAAVPHLPFLSEYLPDVTGNPGYLAGVAAIFAAGILQGLLVVLLGEEGSGAVLSGIIVGLVVFALFKAPKAVFGLFTGFWRRS